MSQAQIPTQENLKAAMDVAVIESEHGNVSEERQARKAAKIPLYQQIFSFPAMLGGLLVCGVFVARRDFDVDPDLWWHIKVGESILSTHHWPTTDPYSFTASGQPWLAYEWLGDVLIAGAARVGGLRGLQALLIVLGAAILLALYGYATLRSRNSKAGFVSATVLLVLPRRTLICGRRCLDICSDPYAHCPGAVPARQTCSVMVPSSSFSDLDQYTRIVGNRTSHNFALLGLWVEKV